MCAADECVGRSLSTLGSKTLLTITVSHSGGGFEIYLNKGGPASL